MSTQFLQFDKSRHELTFAWSFPHNHTKYVFDLFDETLGTEAWDSAAIKGARPGTGASGWGTAYWVGPGPTGTATYTGVDPAAVHADHEYSIRVALPDEGGGTGGEARVSGAAILSLPDPSGSVAAAPPSALIPLASAPSAPAAVSAAVYSPPNPEPSATDGQRLSMQGPDVQAFYVSNFGPGIVAATQFVIDHNNQLAALGQANFPADPCANAPMIPLVDWINKYQGGTVQGQVYAQVQVPDCPDGPTRRGIAIPSTVATTGQPTLPAGPGVGGADVGIGGLAGAGGGGFGGFGSTSTAVPDQRQTGAPPPTVGGIIAQVEANPVLAIAVAVGAFFLLGRRR